MNNGKGSSSTFKYIPANLVTSEQSIKFWTFLALLHNRYWNEGVIGLHQVVLRKIQVNWFCYISPHLSEESEQTKITDQHRLSKNNRQWTWKILGWCSKYFSPHRFLWSRNYHHVSADLQNNCYLCLGPIFQHTIWSSWRKQTKPLLNGHILIIWPHFGVQTLNGFKDDEIKNGRTDRSANAWINKQMIFYLHLLSTYTHTHTHPTPAKRNVHMK